MSDDRGFSLIEVLVALFILATISVAGTSIILRSVQSREALTETSAHVLKVARHWTQTPISSAEASVMQDCFSPLYAMGGRTRFRTRLALACLPCVMCLKVET